MKKFFIILPSMLLLLNTAFAQNCNAVANMSVDYTEDCKAIITWDMPSITSSEILWDNTAGMTNMGYLSSRWMLEDDGRIIIADDFDIPSGVTWTIEEVTFRGFYQTGYGGVPPHYIGIEIYTNNGNKPGTKIYEEPYLTPNEWGFQGIRSVTLPEPFEITEAGKYWISIYGTYETVQDEEYRYYIHLASVPAGAPVHVYQYNNWSTINDVPDLPSMYFSIKGSKEGEAEPAYNIYRDGGLIATVVTETSYTDEEFDAYQEHTWTVKMVCETGGESNPASITKEACDYQGIDDIPLGAFTVHPNPTTGDLRITSCDLRFTSYDLRFTSCDLRIVDVEIFDVIGQLQKSEIVNRKSEIVNRKSEIVMDISHLPSGMYFVKILTASGEVVKKVIKQ